MWYLFYRDKFTIDKTEYYLVRDFKYPHLRMDTYHLAGNGFHMDACNYAIYSIAMYTPDTIYPLIERHKVIIDDDF